MKNEMKLSEMPIGTALLLKKEKGVNETFNKSIKEGAYFIEIRKTKTTWEEFELAEQPKRQMRTRMERKYEL